MSNNRQVIIASSWIIFAAIGFLSCTGSGKLGIVGRKHPDVLYSVQTHLPIVALTIDDGPDPATTPLILKVLAENNAKATFFLLTDRIHGNEHIVRDMVAGGHELGNHMTRDEPSINLSRDNFMQELRRAHKILSRFTTPKWFRPGSGWYDDKMITILKENDYQCVLGSIYPLDAHLPFSWFAQQFILRLTKPGGVIVLHDTGNRGLRTIQTLSKVLPTLRQRGYRVVTLTQLSAIADSS